MAIAKTVYAVRNYDQPTPILQSNDISRITQILLNNGCPMLAYVVFALPELLI